MQAMTGNDVLGWCKLMSDGPDLNVPAAQRQHHRTRWCCVNFVYEATHDQAVEMKRTGHTVIKPNLKPDTTKLIGDEELWKLVNIYGKRLCIIAASTSGTDDTLTGGGGGGMNAYQRQSGLVPGHAYSILRVYNDSESGMKLLQLRNPWGKFEWTGPFGDGSACWKQFPHLAKTLHLVEDDNDGIFWIPFQEFLDHFDRFHICIRARSLNDISYHVKENCGDCCGPVCGCCIGCVNFWGLCAGCRVLYCSRELNANLGMNQIRTEAQKYDDGY